MKILKKIISRKGINIVFIPFFVIFVQLFIRKLLHQDINTIGISLGALSLGQLLPYLSFDHLIANKVLGTTPYYTLEEEIVVVRYKSQTIVNVDEIEDIKNLFYFFTLLNIALFMIIVYLGIQKMVLLHTFFGAFSCVVAWFLILFKGHD